MADIQPRFANLSLRQKIAVIIFLIFASIMLLQVLGLSGGGGSGSGGGAGGGTTAENPAAPTAALPSIPALPDGKLLAANNTNPKAPPFLSSPPSGVKVPPSTPLTSARGQPTPDLTLPPTPFTAQQDLSQTKYVTALNDLQMLKIQKEIAETSQAIVAAKLATVTAEKSITDVLTEPPKSSKKETIVMPGPNSTNMVPGGLPPPPLGMLGSNAGGPGTYSVHSVSMEQEQWHAVVKFKEQYFDVSVGDTLPPDGSLVKAIDQKGVTLETAGFEQKIPLTFTTSMPSGKSGKSESSGGT